MNILIFIIKTSLFLFTFNLALFLFWTQYTIYNLHFIQCAQNNKMFYISSTQPSKKYLLVYKLCSLKISITFQWDAFPDNKVKYALELMKCLLSETEQYLFITKSTTNEIKLL